MINPVVVLLRVLEYYEGILFLTTNRIRTIDTAFQSRIHLAISYPPLAPHARLQLWKDWIEKSTGVAEPNWMTESVVQQLLTRNTNGREIRNIMRVAQSVAQNEKRAIQANDIFQGLDAMDMFSCDLRQQETDGTAFKDRCIRYFLSLQGGLMALFLTLILRLWKFLTLGR